MASRSDDAGAPSRHRTQLSLPEAMLWARLRLRPHGLKFRKQHRAVPYTLDFYCAERALVIEIDGEAHNRGDRPARDARRDAWCRAGGLAVLRVAAAEVLRDPDEVADAIARYALALPRVFDAPERRRRGKQNPSVNTPPSASPPPPSAAIPSTLRVDGTLGGTAQRVGEETPPSAPPPPPHQDGEEQGRGTPPHLDGEVASRSDDGGVSEPTTSTQDPA